MSFLTNSRSRLWLPTTPPIAVGDTYQGGVVFYLLQSGDLGYSASVQHGLIAHTSDQSAGLPWAVPAYQSTLCPIDPWFYYEIGRGNINTHAIVAQNGAGNDFAAGICHNLSSGGYTDWLLPSFYECAQLHEQYAAVGGFTNAWYWFAQESGQYNGVMYNYVTGADGANTKGSTGRVRAIRYF